MIDFSLKWFLTGGGFGLFIAILPYFVMSKKDKIKTKLDIDKHFKEHDININAEFENFKNNMQSIIDKYDNITMTTKDFTELTNAFEKLMSAIDNFCILRLKNIISDTEFAKYYQTLQDIGDYNLIEDYYKITKMEYKETNYRLFYTVYNGIKDGKYQLIDM